MISLLQSWPGKVEVNGIVYQDVAHIPSTTQFTNDWHIKLLPKTRERVTERNSATTSEATTPAYRITVKRYMTEKSSPGFDFMAKWNNDIPMPLRTMTGVKVKETRGMVYMKLHGDIWATRITTCMKCGKKLTNPVSQYFGIGPECGGHNYVNPFDSDEELQEAVNAYKKKLQSVTWEGWVIKSAIQEAVELTDYPFEDSFKPL